MANKQAQGRKGNPASGRQLGTPNKRTTMKEYAAMAKAMGVRPLEFVLGIMNDKKATRAERFDAAKAALPYCHPQLRSVDFQGHLTVGISAALQDFIAGNTTAARSFLGFDREDQQSQEAIDGRPLLDN